MKFDTFRVDETLGNTKRNKCKVPNNLIIPTLQAVDAFINCRNKPSIKIIQSLCESCGVNTDELKIIRLFEVYHLYQTTDSELDKLFIPLRSPAQTKLEDVIMAVVALNSIYNTRMSKAATYLTAQNIYGQLKSIYENLNLNPGSAINTLASINKRNDPSQQYIYSFATKFCSFLKPNSFPIFDSYSSNLVYYFIQSKYSKDTPTTHSDLDLFGNALYYDEAYSEFLALFKLSGKFNYKEIDIFLWMYGKMLRIAEDIEFNNISYKPPKIAITL